jgi:hypothetical protein
MIRRHEANSAWWGSPVGILLDPSFFAASTTEQSVWCEPFAWIEFRSPLRAAPPSNTLARAGFQWIDAQIEFRISINAVASTPSLDDLEVVFGDEAPFIAPFSQSASFGFERYLELPGVDAPFLDRRFQVWAAALAAANPAWSLEVRQGGQPQGWFLSEPSGGTTKLTLAMLTRDATITGMHLYHRALCAYALRGARVGTAGFSVRNTAVHNVYAKLGARFTEPVGCWVRLGDHYEQPSTT